MPSSPAKTQEAADPKSVDGPKQSFNKPAIDDWHSSLASQGTFQSTRISERRAAVKLGLSVVVPGREGIAVQKMAVFYRCTFAYI